MLFSFIDYWSKKAIETRERKIRKNLFREEKYMERKRQHFKILNLKLSN